MLDDLNAFRRAVTHEATHGVAQKCDRAQNQARRPSATWALGTILSELSPLASTSSSSKNVGQAIETYNGAYDLRKRKSRTSAKCALAVQASVSASRK